MTTGLDDRAWLEFVAELMAEPLTELPTDRIEAMLRDTFGASGASTAADRELAARIRQLLSGLDHQVRAYASALRAVEAAAPDVASTVSLTPRERSVLTLLSEGMTAGAIGRRLGIAERTVHKHLERCYAKLGVADRLSAVLHAQRLGLVAAA
ncbi:MAG: LuxR C-terminal-related transcriptional regulator [Pseudonocardia sp.]|nr:LuxR C-terminal-related transcriptional regulator [Pseudonocardia sp.]